MNNLQRLPTLDQIFALQREMKKMPQLDLPAKHHFADGLYARELFRPKGTLIVGKIHAKRHFYILTKGEVLSWTANGRQRIKAGQLVITERGTKRVTLALEDSTCITFHATDKLELDEIEAELIIPEIAELGFDELPLLEETTK